MRLVFLDGRLLIEGRDYEFLDDLSLTPKLRSDAPVAAGDEVQVIRVGSSSPGEQKGVHRRMRALFRVAPVDSNPEDYNGQHSVMWGRRSLRVGGFKLIEFEV